MVVQGIGELGKVFVAQGAGLPNPGVQEDFGRSGVVAVPKHPEVFFEQVGLVQGQIHFHEIGQPGHGGGVELVQRPEQEEAAALDDLLLLALEVPVQIPPGFIDGAVGQGHHVVGVMNDIQVGEYRPYGLQVGGGHVHGHGPELGPAPLELFQEGDEGLGVPALVGMEYLACLQVQDHGHVVMALADGKLVHRDIAHRPQLAPEQLGLQVLLEQVFDQIPAHPQQPGYLLDVSNPAQVHHEAVKGVRPSALAPGELDGLPQGGPAAPAALLVPVQDHELGAPAHRDSPELTGEGAGQHHFPPGCPAASAETLLSFPGHVVGNRPSPKFSAHKQVVDQSQGVIKVAGRRHGRTPLVLKHFPATRDTAKAATFLSLNQITPSGHLPDEPDVSYYALNNNKTPLGQHFTGRS